VWKRFRALPVVMTAGQGLSTTFFQGTDNLRNLQQCTLFSGGQDKSNNATFIFISQ